MRLGELRVKEFLEKTQGEVFGRHLSDGKDRYFQATYEWQENLPGMLRVRRTGSALWTHIPAVIPLDESLVAFFGLYSGDGAKGSENQANLGRIYPSISFSQREPNLVRFAVDQFRMVFPECTFVFSLGEDSAYFMAGEGLDELTASYSGTLPPVLPLEQVHPTLTDADARYLAEVRHTQRDVREDLAFYYQHKPKMEQILAARKALSVQAAGIVLSPADRVTASLRRPYKKGARVPGGSSRSDETFVGNVNGMGELFLKMLHEIEASIQEDQPVSPQGLVVWADTPSAVGEVVDLEQFFQTHPYGRLAGQRPSISEKGAEWFVGIWRQSKTTRVRRFLRIDPLWCYAAGLYLAEGSTEKAKMFRMYQTAQSKLALGFTSSENTSLELILRALNNLFEPGICVEGWKVKVGSQYFPELVVIGLKNAVPMLRGGESGDGKLRTMEISLAILDWALQVAPSIAPYRARFTHVEPTGAGVPRIDFAGSSSLCKWFFPLVIYATFSSTVQDPSSEFVV